MKKLMALFILVLSFNLLADVTCETRGDFEWTLIKTVTVETFKDLKVKEAQMIFEAMNRQTDVDTITDIFKSVDKNELMLFNAKLNGSGENFTSVTIQAGGNFFEYLFNQKGENTALIVDGSCE